MDPPIKGTSAAVLHPAQGDGGEEAITSMGAHEEPVSLKTQGEDSPDEFEEDIEQIGEMSVSESGFSSSTPPPVSVIPTVYNVNTHEESQTKYFLERFEEHGQLIREELAADRFPPHPEDVSFASTVTPVDDTTGENLTEIPGTEYGTEGPGEREFYDLSGENVKYEGVQSEVLSDKDGDVLDEVVESTTPSLDVVDGFEYSTTAGSKDEYGTDSVLDYDLDSFTTVVPVLDDITTVLDASYDAVSGVVDSGTVLLSPTLYSQKIHFEYGDLIPREGEVHIRPNRIYISGSGITSSTDALFDVGDSRITTFPSTLDIDSSGSFDPSLISKATNFQATHYSTTTRSATVTTTISRDNLDHISTGLYCNCNTSNGTSDPISRSMKSNCSCNITEANVQVSGQVGDKQMELHTESDGAYEIATTESIVNGKAVEVEFLSSAAKEHTGTSVYEHETTEILSVTRETTSAHVPEVKVVAEDRVSRLFINVSSVSNDIGVNGNYNRSNMYDIQNGTYVKNADKKPLNMHTSGTSNVESSTSADVVNFPLGVTVIIVFSALLLAVMILGMLLLRRRFKNHSKVYLSFEAKPRAMFTRPMRPALLPTEIGQVSLHPHDVPRPRAPILLLEENQCGSGGHTSVPSPNQDGVDNVAFVEIPLEELNPGALVAKDVKVCDPPKYSPDIQLENDTDSGIRVWSSTGSLHSLSPSLSRCSRPPPPYTPEGTYVTTQNCDNRHIGNIKLSWPDGFIFKKDRQNIIKRELQSEKLSKNQGKELPYYSDILEKSMESETSNKPVPVHDWSALSEKLEKITVSD